MQQPSDQYKQDVERNVETFIENLRQFSIIIEDFQEDSQIPFQNKINELVDNMITLDKIKDGYNVEVPIGVLHVIDEGKNPDLYTKRSLADCYQSQQKTDGKIQSLSKFKNILENEIKQNFEEVSTDITNTVEEFVKNEMQQAEKVNQQNIM